MKSHSTISIIMATYNRAHFIKESLESISIQTFRDWECLIIDDGSNDHTIDIVAEWTSKDDRFKYFLRGVEYKKGISGCRNFGLDLAKGDFIVFFDDDDIAHPQNLEVSLDSLRLSGTNFCNFQKKPFYSTVPETKPLPGPEQEFQKFSLKDIGSFLTGQRAMASCTVLWKKKCFERTRFNEELHYAEELECYSRILMQGYEGISINSILYYNRKHQNSSTGAFEKGHEMRRESMLKAARMILDNLGKMELVSAGLAKFFVRLGFRLHSHSLVQKALGISKASILTRVQYSIGYFLYPVLRPILKLKSKAVI